MARLRDLKNNYTSGELDVSMYARADNKHFFNGARKMRNVVALPQGGWRPRPGSAFIATVPLNAGALSDTRLITHAISTLQTYLVMLHHTGARIFKNGLLVETLTGEAWQSSELSEIGWTQNLDTLLIFHLGRRPRAVQRQGSDATWGTFNWALNNTPRFAFPDGVYVNGVNEVQELTVGQAAGNDDYPTGWVEDDPFTLTLGGEETSSILWTATQATLATRIQTALRALSVTSATGITVVTHGLDTAGNMKFTITMGGDDGGKPWGEIVPIVKANAVFAAYPIWAAVTTKGEYPGEDTWSATRGWPRCGTFFQGRLWLAGSTQRPQTLWASRSGDPNDFNIKETADDYGIEVSADTDDIAAFQQIFVGRHLQLFASSGEFYIPISDTDPITPTNISLRRTTARGSKSGLPVFDIEGATCFVQAARRVETTGRRRGVALRELLFADTEQAYQANPLSLLAPHLIRDPRRIAVRRTNETNASDYILAVNEDDGSLTWFCTLRTQEVNAFTLSTTAGLFKDVGVDGDDVYVVVERTPVATATRTLEKFVDGLFVDCAVYDFAVGAPVTTVAVAHLIGATVQVYVDGNWRDPVVVPASGNVTLDPPAEENYQIGIAWPEVDETTGFVYMVEDMPPAAELQDGPTFGRKMRVVDCTIDVLEMRDLIANGNRITNAQVGVMQFDVAPPLYSGLKRIKGMLGWGDGVVRYGNVKPGPVTVRAVSKRVAV